MNSNMPPAILNLKRTALIFILISLVAIVLPGSASVSAQEVADTIKVNTRVVFMDALVKDKRTGVPIADLKLENFQVYDDGKPRSTSYVVKT